MEKKYLTVKEIWDFIDKIMPGAIQKKGDKYTSEALECLFFVTEDQGKRLNNKSIVVPRSNEWWKNRNALIEECENLNDKDFEKKCINCCNKGKKIKILLTNAGCTNAVYTQERNLLILFGNSLLGF